jgi:hypothetical protein
MPSWRCVGGLPGNKARLLIDRMFVSSYPERARRSRHKHLIGNEVEGDRNATYYVARQCLHRQVNKIWDIALECTRY